MARRWTVLRLFTFMIFILNPITGQEDPCQTTTRLPDEDKRPQDATGSGSLCDQLLPKAWYRVDHDLASTCPPGGHCGTVHTAWLNGSVPSEAEGVVNRTVCVRNLTACCSHTVDIRVRSCGLYRMYELPPLPTTCPAAYCTGIPSPSTTLSTTTPTTTTTITTSSGATTTTNITTNSTASISTMITTNTSSTEFLNETSDFTTHVTPEENTAAGHSFSSGVPTTDMPPSISTNSTSSQQTGNINLRPGEIAAIVAIAVVVLLVALTAVVCWCRTNIKKSGMPEELTQVSYGRLQDTADGDRGHGSDVNHPEGETSGHQNQAFTESETDISTQPSSEHYERLDQISRGNSDSYESVRNGNTRQPSPAATPSPHTVTDSEGYVPMQNNAQISGSREPDASTSMSAPEPHQTESSSYLTPHSEADCAIGRGSDCQSVGKDTKSHTKTEDGNKSAVTTNREYETTTGTERQEPTPTTDCDARSSLTQRKESDENITGEGSQHVETAQTYERQTQKSLPVPNEDPDRTETEKDGGERNKATAKNQSSSKIEKTVSMDSSNGTNSSSLDDESNNGDPTRRTGNPSGLIDELNSPSPARLHRLQEHIKSFGLQGKLQRGDAPDETGNPSSLRDDPNFSSDSEHLKADEAGDIPGEREGGMTADVTGGEGPDEAGGPAGLIDGPSFPSDSGRAEETR